MMPCAEQYGPVVDYPFACPSDIKDTANSMNNVKYEKRELSYILVIYDGE